MAIEWLSLRQPLFYHAHFTLWPPDHRVLRLIQNLSFAIARDDRVDIISAVHRAKFMARYIIPEVFFRFIQAEFILVDPHTVRLRRCEAFYE